MKKKKNNPVHSIQQCGCGSIRLDLGNFSLKYDKEAFLAFAHSVHQAAQMLRTPKVQPKENVYSFFGRDKA